MTADATQPDFSPVANALADAVARQAFPCATIEVGTQAAPLWNHACGRLWYEDSAPLAAPETVFDLASLTKVVATTTVLMRLVETGAIGLLDPLSRWLPEWRGVDRQTVTVADLLEHASGLTAHLPFFRDHVGRADFEHAICTLPLEYPPRTRSIYSDLGFILLAFIARDAADGVDIDRQFERVATELHLGDLRYRPPRTWLPRIAPTEMDPWRGRLLRGEVHDENGWALNGDAGHAGLFGTASAVGHFARAILTTVAGVPSLAQPETLRRFLTRSQVNGSSRALGWDTMLPTSSCGHRFSPRAIGHTGFTGTSLWIDPERDLYIVLLTNRVHPNRSNEAILQVRPALHDAIVDILQP